MTFMDNWGSHVQMWSCEELENLSPVFFWVLFEEDP